jgi:hypothetical protein
MPSSAIAGMPSYAPAGGAPLPRSRAGARKSLRANSWVSKEKLAAEFLPREEPLQIKARCRKSGLYIEGK